MAWLVNEIMQDLGLYNTVPGTFPEFITWIASSSIALAILAGMIKLFFWTIASVGKVGR